MDRIDGPKAQFEKVVLNQSEDDQQNAKMFGQSLQNTYRDGDILNLESNQDLKNTQNLIEAEQFNTTRKVEQDNLNDLIENNNKNRNSPSLTVESKDQKLLMNQSFSGGAAVGDNCQSIFKSVEQNNLKNETPKTKIEETNKSVRRRTLKECKDLIVQSNRAEYLQKKLNSKVIQHQPQIFDLKLVNQLRRRMVYFFNTFTIEGRKKFLNQESIRQIIGDKSDIFQLNVGTFFSKMLCSVYIQSFKNAILSKNLAQFLFNPHSPATFWMKLIFTIYNVCFFIGLSIIVIYLGGGGGSSSEELIYKITIFFWFIETFVHLNTQIYDSLNLISDRGQIISRYLKMRAAFDLLPLLFLIASPESQIQRIIFECITFLKIKNVYSDVNEIQKKLCMLVKNYYVIQLVNLILKMLIAGHVIACMWYLIGLIELNIIGADTTWYDSGLSGNKAWWVLYLESFYWTLTLMTTGSNIANTVTQMFFTTFIMLFTTILFGYMMNVTGIIISQLDKQDENKRLDLNILNEYMRNNKISKTLQARVNIDLEYYYLNNMDKIQEDKSAVLNKISPNLQNLLKYEYCCQIIEEIDFVKQKFSQETISELSNFLIEEFYLPNQTIFLQNQHNEIGLIFVLKGQIELSQSMGKDSQKKPIRLVNKGDLIGQTNFFTGLAYDKCAISTKFTKIVRIEREKFIQIIQKRQKDLEIFCQLRDTVLMYDNYDIVKDSCSICKATIHLENHCPLVHTSKSQLYYKNRFFQNTAQNRGQIKRKNQSSKNSLKHHKDVSFLAQKVWKMLIQEQRDNSDEENDISYLKQFLGSEGLSSDEENQKTRSFTLSDLNCKQEDIREETQQQLGKRSTKRFSQGVNNDIATHKTGNTAVNSNNINVNSNQFAFNNSINFDTINIESQLNTIEETKSTSKHSASMYNKKYSLLMKQTKQSMQQFVLEDDVLKKSIIKKSQSNLFANQLDPESRTELNQNLITDAPITKQQIPDTYSLKNIALNADKNDFDKNFNTQNIDDNNYQLQQDLKLKRSQEAFDIWEFDKLKDFTRYFTSGNSKLILIKRLKFQRKKQKPVKRKQLNNLSSKMK